MTVPTALPSLAAVTDLRRWPGVEVADDQEQAGEAVLARASAVVRRAAGRLWVGTDGRLVDVPPEIPAIVVESAARFWNNPHGAALIVRGPFSEQFGQALEAGVFLTATQKADIDAIVGRPRAGGIRTIRTTRHHAGDEFDAVWVTGQDGTGLFPLPAGPVVPRGY